MGNIPYFYSIKNLYARRLTTILTVLGMGLVVFVFAAMLMLAEGLERTLADTGSPDNLMVLRRGAASEIQSTVTRDQAAILSALPEIQTAADGSRLISRELVILVGLPKRGASTPSNVTVRGLTPIGLALRPQVQLISGRLFRPGASEIIVGKQIAEMFTSTGVGEQIALAGREWTVVGIFDAGSTGFSSEIWGDAHQLMQAFRRDSYSIVVLGFDKPELFDEVRAAVENDTRLTHRVLAETEYYAQQSERMSQFLRVVGVTLSVIFSIAAIIGATITMQAAVAHRTTEIATLRAIGFQRSNILIAFVSEALLYGILGGIIGLALASMMQFFTISTMNWQSFSEVAFRLTLTRAIIVKSLFFAFAMGLVGGFFPAYRAAQKKIVEGLR
jgi:ABC-type antimicrobial peptide transport system permease subunit